jgi:hypothetical protein
MGRSVLAEEKRKLAEGDAILLEWLVQRVNEQGLKAVADVLEHDAANFAKAVAGKRKISMTLRKRIGEQMGRVKRGQVEN